MEVDSSIFTLKLVLYYLVPRCLFLMPPAILGRICYCLSVSHVLSSQIWRKCKATVGYGMSHWQTMESSEMMHSELLCIREVISLLFFFSFLSSFLFFFFSWQWLPNIQGFASFSKKAAIKNTYPIHNDKCVLNTSHPLFFCPVRLSLLTIFYCICWTSFSILQVQGTTLDKACRWVFFIGSIYLWQREWVILPTLGHRCQISERPLHKFRRTTPELCAHHS